MPERLVWCSITGQGVGRGGRAMDPSLQATMGLMELTGERDGPPLRVPVPLIDFMTGMYAAQSVLAALWQAERTGTGAHLDCALLDSAATLTSTVALFSLSGEFEPEPDRHRELPARAERRVRGGGRRARPGDRAARAPLGGAVRRARPARVARRSALRRQRRAARQPRARQRADRRGDRDRARRRVGRADQRSRRDVRAAARPRRRVARPAARRAGAGRASSRAARSTSRCRSSRSRGRASSCRGRDSASTPDEVLGEL